MKTIVNQTEISWEEAGSGPVLLLVHGLPFQRSMWKPQLAWLSKRFRVVALDLPGFGTSGAPVLAPTMDSLADFLADFCRILGKDPIVFGGHSMGGYAGLAFAKRHPTLVRGLVMIASRAIADAPDVAANRRSIVARLATEPPEFVAEAMLPRMLASDSRDISLRQSVRELMEPLRSDGIAWAQEAIASRVDFSGLLKDIACPALVVAGEKDQVAPLEEAGIMAAGFRQGRLEVVEKAGHMVSWEQPNVVNAALEKWMLALG
ncbi:MAG TPA: alpha/beta hydrolase [Fibrobacteria bacterium]|nr:alpha/beta hydrolase [Fibrobacteria bacterium]